MGIAGHPRPVDPHGVNAGSDLDHKTNFGTHRETLFIPAKVAKNDRQIGFRSAVAFRPISQRDCLLGLDVPASRGGDPKSLQAAKDGVSMQVAFGHLIHQKSVEQNDPVFRTQQPCFNDPLVQVIRNPVQGQGRR